MTGPQDDHNERLKSAFLALAGTSADECSDDEIDRIWRAASGELDADARRNLVDRMASSPAAAEAWRVAQAMREAQGYGAASGRRAAFVESDMDRAGCRPRVLPSGSDFFNSTVRRRNPRMSCAIRLHR